MTTAQEETKPDFATRVRANPVAWITLAMVAFISLMGMASASSSSGSSTVDKDALQTDIQNAYEAEYGDSPSVSCLIAAPAFQTGEQALSPGDTFLCDVASFVHGVSVVNVEVGPGGEPLWSL